MKKWYFLCFSVVLLCLLACPVRGEDYCFDGYDSGWDAFLEELPEEIREEVGEISMEDPLAAVDELSEKLNFSYWLEQILQLGAQVFAPSLRTASSIFGMLLLLASVNLLAKNLNGASLNGVFTLCTDCSMAVVILGVAETLIDSASLYLDRLCGIMNIMLPVTGAVCLMEGALTQLAVHRTAMLLYIAVTGNLNNLLLKPLFGVLFAFSAVGSVFQHLGLSGFVGGIRKFVMTVISLFTMVFSFILGLQTVLARSADSLGLKTARLALGSFVPIIGGTLSEALTTVREGMGVIRSVTGIGGIVVILLLVLPTVLSLFCNNILLSFCHMTAEVLGLDKSAAILQDVKSVLSILCALVYATSLLFIMALILFAKVGSGS